MEVIIANYIWMQYSVSAPLNWLGKDMQYSLLGQNYVRQLHWQIRLIIFYIADINPTCHQGYGKSRPLTRSFCEHIYYQYIILN